MNLRSVNPQKRQSLPCSEAARGTALVDEGPIEVTLAMCSCLFAYLGLRFSDCLLRVQLFDKPGILKGAFEKLSWQDLEALSWLFQRGTRKSMGARDECKADRLEAPRRFNQGACTPTHPVHSHTSCGWNNMKVRQKPMRTTCPIGHGQKPFQSQLHGQRQEHHLPRALRGPSSPICRSMMVQQWVSTVETSCPLQMLTRFI